MFHLPEVRSVIVKQNSMKRRPTRATPSRGKPVTVDGWDIKPLHTPWLGPELSLDEALKLHVPPLERGQVFVLSEKVVVMLTGRSLPIADYEPGRLAKLLVRFVNPRPGSRGLSVPQKMEYVVRNVGILRVVAAAVAGAVTRACGVRGTFYRIAGPVARDLDGGRPPFEHLLFPPLNREDGEAICEGVAAVLDTPVVIADLNDFGGSIRARSADAPDMDTLMRVLRTNPLGQRDTRTPFAILTAPERSRSEEQS